MTSTGPADVHEPSNGRRNNMFEVWCCALVWCGVRARPVPSGLPPKLPVDPTVNHPNLLTNNRSGRLAWGAAPCGVGEHAQAYVAEFPEQQGFPACTLCTVMCCAQGNLFRLQAAAGALPGRPVLCCG